MSVGIFSIERASAVPLGRLTETTNVIVCLNAFNKVVRCCKKLMEQVALSDVHYCTATSARFDSPTTMQSADATVRLLFSQMQIPKHFVAVFAKDVD